MGGLLGQGGLLGGLLGSGRISTKLLLREAESGWTRSDLSRANDSFSAKQRWGQLVTLTDNQGSSRCQELPPGVPSATANHGCVGQAIKRMEQGGTDLQRVVGRLEKEA